MSLELSAREQIIPAGACIDTEAERFMRMDMGEAAPADFEAGRIACQGCIQSRICEQNSAEIGAQLYTIAGYKSSFVGGEQTLQAPEIVRANVIDTPIPFDIRELPNDPALALSFIRRAVRAGQLVPGPHTPESVHMLTRRFMGEIASTDPKLYGKLINPSHMTEERANRGIQNITVALFQQVDFANVLAGKKSRQRYNPMHIDPVAHFEVTRRFAADMIDLDQRGFRKPERQALVFGVDEYQVLIDRYLSDKSISPSDFHYILDHNINDPERAFRERLARLHVLREAYFGTDLTEARMRERARWRLDPDATVENMPKHQGRLSAVAVEKIYASADEGLLTPSGEGESQTDVVLTLRELFGTDPTFAPASSIARFTHLPVDEAVKKCEAIQDHIRIVLDERGDDETVPEPFIRHHVLRSRFEPYETIKQDYVVSRLHNRLQQRARLTGAQNQVPQWAIERAATLYSIDGAEPVTETLYGVTTLQPYLVQSLSEMALLQDVTYKDDVNQICDPHTGRYMTFSPALRDLTPEDRLVFAKFHGLSRLLYGVEFDFDHLVALVGDEDITMYYLNQVLPKCDELLARESSEGMPTLLRRLSDDLLLLESVAIPETPTRSHLPPHVTTMIGGLSLMLGPDAIKLQGDNASSRWLRQTIFERCKPNHLEVVADVTRAIEQGVLEVTGDEASGFMVTFAEYIRENGDEQEIAALAHCLGLDIFMFGYDMKELLEARLEVGIIQTAHGLMNLIRQTATEVSEDPDEALFVPKVAHPESTRNSFFSSLDDESAKWLLGNIVAAKRPKGGHAVSEAAKRAKQALAAGHFQVVGDEAGYMIRIDPRTVGTTSVQALRRFVDECGIRGVLDPASSRLLDTTRSTAADQRRRAELIKGQFETAVKAIERTFLRSMTPTQLPRIHRELMVHFGKGEATAVNGAWERRVLSHALQEMGLTFRTYREMQERALFGKAVRPSMQFATMVIGDPQTGTRPTKFIDALKASLMGGEPTAMQLASAQEDLDMEIANFGKWLAQQDWPDEPKTRR